MRAEVVYYPRSHRFLISFEELPRLRAAVLICPKEGVDYTRAVAGHVFGARAATPKERSGQEKLPAAAADISKYRKAHSGDKMYLISKSPCQNKLFDADV